MSNTERNKQYASACDGTSAGAPILCRLLRYVLKFSSLVGDRVWSSASVAVHWH